MQPYWFYHQHLDRVSRSFSFCILELSEDTKRWVALSYLLFRVLDTIEDACWMNAEDQLVTFKQFQEFLSASNHWEEGDIQHWLKRFPDTILPSEQLLLADLSLLLTDLETLPSAIQEKLIYVLMEMMEGMIYFIQHHKSNGQLRLISLDETNRYCYVVAGIVGHLLTDIFTYTILDFSYSELLIYQSTHFGIFLQKINLLKDQREDHLAGRFFISSYFEVRDSLMYHARVAMDYLNAIPIVAGRSYRLFCAWSLFIGLASLKWIDKNVRDNQQYKISYRETNALVSKIRRIIDDSYALEKLFNDYTHSNRRS